MADDFDSGICNNTWWTAATSAPVASASCSSSLTDTSAGAGTTASGTTFSWLSTATAADIEPSSSVSNYGLSPTPWNPSILNSSVRDETSYHGLLHEPVNYQQQFMLGQQPEQTSFPVMLQPSIYDHQRSSVNYQQPYDNNSFANFTQLLKSSPPKQPAQSGLQFSNDAPFWSPSVKPGVFSSSSGSFEQKPSWSSIATKANMEPVTKKSSSTSSSSEASLKKPRIETPSPLPTFKVRKEKLGDRITALQQLVSPFGKTDTASVLQEAIDYIKFLHDQVNMLSTPYLKNGNSMQPQHQQSSDKSNEGEGKQDLRSRGLCLVPMDSIYTVTNETAADFWTPTFGGSYR